MTREEIIQKGKKKFPPVIIKELREDGSIVLTDVNATIRNAYIQGLIDNNCLLPSDLDEAAFKYENELWESGYKNCGYSPQEVNDAFKAGAEWLAGQGISLSYLIAWYIQSVDAHEPVWTKEHLEELVKDYILIPKK